VQTSCSGCGLSINVQPYRLRRNGSVFCSMACRAANGPYPGHPRTGATLTCEVCGAPFYRKRAEVAAARFCSYRCGGKARPIPPAPKGAHRSPGTEFVAGERPGNWRPVGTVTVRRRRGEDRAWVKVAEPKTWRPRAIATWEAAHGSVPAGMVVHHINRDPLDDRLENLELLSRAAHVREHRHDR
jgi:hypothetical protein